MFSLLCCFCSGIGSILTGGINTLSNIWAIYRLKECYEDLKCAGWCDCEDNAREIEMLGQQIHFDDSVV